MPNNVFVIVAYMSLESLLRDFSRVLKKIIIITVPFGSLLEEYSSYPL
jgi:hypothetical protein